MKGSKTIGNHSAQGKAGTRGGYVMLIVMMMILTTSALAAVHARHLNAALRVEQARVRSESFKRGPVMVLAIACRRLDTGDPPSGGASYSYSHTVDGLATLYRIEYSNSGADRWAVTANPDPTAGPLAPLPDSFNL